MAALLPGAASDTGFASPPNPTSYSVRNLGGNPDCPVRWHHPRPVSSANRHNPARCVNELISNRPTTLDELTSRQQSAEPIIRLVTTCEPLSMWFAFWQLATINRKGHLSLGRSVHPLSPRSDSSCGARSRVLRMCISQGVCGRLEMRWRGPPRRLVPGPPVASGPRDETQTDAAIPAG